MRTLSKHSNSHIAIADPAFHCGYRETYLYNALPSMWRLRENHGPRYGGLLGSEARRVLETLPLRKLRQEGGMK